jgi:hypothetical protein
MQNEKTDRMMKGGESVTRGRASASDLLPQGTPEQGECAHCGLGIVRMNGVWHHATFTTNHRATPRR